jgi:hypothetical protein
MAACSELIRWTFSIAGLANLANGVPSPILAQTSMERYLIGFAVGNTTCPISLNTTIGNVEQVRIYAPAGSSFIDCTRLLQNGSDNGLSFVANGAASAAVSYTIVWADAPPGILSTQVRV